MTSDNEKTLTVDEWLTHTKELGYYLTSSTETVTVREFRAVQEFLIVLFSIACMIFGTSILMGLLIYFMSACHG